MKAKKIFGILLIMILLVASGYELGYYLGNVYLKPRNASEQRITLVTNLKEKNVEEEIKEIDYNKELNGLVPLSNYDNSFVIDLKYATENNFTGKRVYKANVCALQKSTLNKLIAANEEFKTLGYKIKIWDAYRPSDVQQYFWALVKDRNYIASPYVNGSRHNRGAAVDITLVDKDGKELEMPTVFDEFNPKAHRDNPNMSQKAKANLELLTTVMSNHGFNPIQTEWWHYDDSEADNYPILNVPLENFLK